MQSSQMIYWIENEGVKIIVNPYPENHKQLEKVKRSSSVDGQCKAKRRGSQKV